MQTVRSSSVLFVVNVWWKGLVHISKRKYVLFLNSIVACLLRYVSVNPVDTSTEKKKILENIESLFKRKTHARARMKTIYLRTNNNRAYRRAYVRLFIWCSLTWTRKWMQTCKCRRVYIYIWSQPGRFFRIWIFDSVFPARFFSIPSIYLKCVYISFHPVVAFLHRTIDHSYLNYFLWNSLNYVSSLFCN